MSDKQTESEKRMLDYYNRRSEQMRDTKTRKSQNISVVASVDQIATGEEIKVAVENAKERISRRSVFCVANGGKDRILHLENIMGVILDLRWDKCVVYMDLEVFLDTMGGAFVDGGIPFVFELVTCKEDGVLYIQGVVGVQLKQSGG
ncbi:MAG: hypothetical protein DRP09_15880 [Candidatus Thorarchaeota archaeon]|nr:MAG: hypothetical protein DRP09_15880 [Candidatus Thorarchaeota archaeon]